MAAMISLPGKSFTTVLTVATGFGIAAQLPYLTKLIHGYHSCKARTRRVHLWQLQRLGRFNVESPFQELTLPDLGLAAQSLLNNALNDDTLDDGYVCDPVFVTALIC